MRTIHCPDTGETCTTYTAYRDSNHWHRFRTSYLATIPAHTCEKCGESVERLEVHHHHYDSLGREMPTDVCALCRKCHKKEPSTLAAIAKRKKPVSKPQPAQKPQQIDRKRIAGQVQRLKRVMAAEGWSYDVSAQIMELEARCAIMPGKAKKGKGAKKPKERATGKERKRQAKRRRKMRAKRKAEKASA